MNPKDKKLVEVIEKIVERKLREYDEPKMSIGRSGEYFDDILMKELPNTVEKIKVQMPSFDINDPEHKAAFKESMIEKLKFQLDRIFK